MEEVALKDDYFVSKKLYPNVDFYSGIIYRALGIPTNMFTVMFALGRLPGWIAHWKEMDEDQATRRSAARARSTPARRSRKYVPIERAVAALRRSAAFVGSTFSRYWPSQLPGGSYSHTQMSWSAPCTSRAPQPTWVVPRHTTCVKWPVSIENAAGREVVLRDLAVPHRDDRRSGSR